MTKIPASHQLQEEQSSLQYKPNPSLTKHPRGSTSSAIDRSANTSQERVQTQHPRWSVLPPASVEVTSPRYPQRTANALGCEANQRPSSEGTPAETCSKARSQLSSPAGRSPSAGPQDGLAVERPEVPPLGEGSNETEANPRSTGLALRADGLIAAGQKSLN